MYTGSCGGIVNGNIMFRECDITVTDQDMYVLEFDSQVLRTPGNVEVRSSREVLSIVMLEWESMKGNKVTDACAIWNMPATCIINTSIDYVSKSRDAYINRIIDYLMYDALCYRSALGSSQRATEDANLDLIVEWFSGLIGIVPVVTDQVLGGHLGDDDLQRAKNYISSFNDISIAAFESLTLLTDSFIMSLALSFGVVDAEKSLHLLNAGVGDYAEDIKYSRDKRVIDTAARVITLYLDK